MRCVHVMAEFILLFHSYLLSLQQGRTADLAHALGCLGICYSAKQLYQVFPCVFVPCFSFFLSFFLSSSSFLLFASYFKMLPSNVVGMNFVLLLLFQEAIQCQRDCVAVRKEILEPTHELLALAHSNLGRSLESAGNYAEAAEVFKLTEVCSIWL